jgi:preprotein translocase subunit YajC
MPQSQAVNPMINLFPIIAIFAIFYFFLIRPQKEKEKEHQKTLANLNKNDEIVTSSGIHGTIVNVKDKTVVVRIDENVKIELEKNCVAIVKKQQA